MRARSASHCNASVYCVCHITAITFIPKRILVCVCVKYAVLVVPLTVPKIQQRCKGYRQ